MVLDKEVQAINTCLIKRAHQDAAHIQPQKQEVLAPQKVLAPQYGEPPTQEVLAPPDVAEQYVAPQNVAPQRQEVLADIQENVVQKVSIEENIKETKEYLEKNKDDEIEEVQLKYESISDSVIILKKPNEVYYEQYKIAKKKALELRTNALNAILEAKNIKTKYNLIQDSDSDDLDDL